LYFVTKKVVGVFVQTFLRRFNAGAERIITAWTCWGAKGRTTQPMAYSKLCRLL
jgi:hypothetical protein